jgi:amidohydrolase
MATIEQRIKDKAQSILPQLVEIRRHLHMNPELSFEEFKTSNFIKSKLEELGIHYDDGFVKTGILGVIKGAKPGRVRALRAELDALPIQELSSHDYKSKIEGRMHACGHDVHMTSMLGAAMILNDMREEIEGDILLVYQPGEELLPGGAKLLLKEGIFNKYKPETILAQHVYPEIESGKVGICSGQYMASADELYITIKGKGGHGALPHLCNDAILISAEIIMALQSVVSRHMNPIIPSVLTIGRINSVGGATNIIPEEVKLEGTFRTLDEDFRKKAHVQIRKIVENICEAYGAKAEVNIMVGYPSLINDVEYSKEIKVKMINYLGSENVIDIPKRMTSEDFAYYSQVMPSCFYRLGVRNESKGITHGVHTSYFDIDENALVTGAGLMAYLSI